MLNPYENEANYMVPIIKVMSYVNNFGDNRMSEEEQVIFKKDIEELRDINNKYGNDLIDFDVFLNQLLIQYKLLVNRAKIYVINAFAAADLDGNGVCNLEEFILLNKNIE